MRTALTQIRDQAVILLAEGRLNYGEIAEKIGVDVSNLYRWRKNSQFAARVDAHRALLNEIALQRAITGKEYRIGGLADRHNKLLRVIESRAAAAEMKDIPGGDTGLLVRQIVASAGEVCGYEYAVDTGTLKELRAIEEQVAKELGQIVTRSEITGKDGGPIRHEHSIERMSDEQIDAELGRIFGPVIVTRTVKSIGAGESGSSSQGEIEAA